MQSVDRERRVGGEGDVGLVRHQTVFGAELFEGARTRSDLAGHRQPPDQFEQRRAPVERGGRPRLTPRRRGDRGKLGRSEWREHRAERVELLVERAVLADRRVRVIAGDGRLQHPIVVGAVPQTEVRATVRHIEAQRSPCTQQLLDRAPGARSRAHVVPLAPVVEPAAPQLAAHERITLATQRHRGRDAGAEGERRHGTRNAAVVDHVARDAVGGREHLDDPAAAQSVTQVGEVGGVAAEGSVLVLDLDGDDRTAVRGLQGHESWDELVVPGVHGGEEAGIARAQSGDAPRQPERDAAVGPLGADVGTGPQEHIEADISGEADEPLDVAPAVETPVALDALVEVPGDVGVDRVRAHRGEAAQPVLPLVGMHPEVVDRAGEDAVGDTVAEDLPLAPRQGRCVVRRRGGRGIDDDGGPAGSRGEKVRHSAPSTSVCVHIIASHYSSPPDFPPIDRYH